MKLSASRTENPSYVRVSVLRSANFLWSYE